MKAIEIHRQFSGSRQEILASLANLLQADETATVSWKPGGKGAVVTFDSRSTLTMLFSYFARFRIIEIDVDEIGTVTMKCVSPEWPFLAGQRHNKFVNALMNRLEYNL